MRLGYLALFCLTSWCRFVLGEPPYLAGDGISGFSWSTIKPSEDLVWNKCYDSYFCARLEVPLDWSNRSNALTVALALIKVPATVPKDDPTFGGSILINPGGPGGSGVDEIIWGGYGIRDSIVDSEGKHFEIVSWDPRGVHHTTPSVSCFGSDWERQLWTYRDWAFGQLDSSEYAFDVKWAASESLAKLCTESEAGNFGPGMNMRQFVSTALTARDMVAIIDAIDQERDSSLDSAHTHTNSQQSLKEQQKPALLNYWGFSYGTYLGNTFASLYPERIGRMLLDGNVDPIDYAATGWLSNLYDNNKNLHWFFYACFHAGRKCPLFDSDTRSLSDIERKVAKLLQHLYEHPLPAVHGGAADVVTYADMTSIFHLAAYAPLFFWPQVAQVAHDLLEGNVTSVLDYLHRIEIPRQPGSYSRDLKPPVGAALLLPKLDNDTEPYPPTFPGSMEGSFSILCGDGAPLSLSKVDWRDRINTLRNQSLIAGPHWAAITFACQHWPTSLRPSKSNRFAGPFMSTLVDYDDRASPILFIGNTADPVTPLRNAVANSKNHEGSVLLTQDTPGHCAGPANPNQCTFDVIRTFFGKGVLPEEGKICSSDRGPWD